MKGLTLLLTLALFHIVNGVAGFCLSSSFHSIPSSQHMTPEGCSAGGNSSSLPLLLRTALGEATERVPVWMMRQAGRHMKAYRDLCLKHPSFRERSESVDLATEISLQPWRAYKVDACILFSDILTPLPAMGLEFDIKEKTGPQLKRVTSWQDVNGMKDMEGEKELPFIGEILRRLRAEVGSSAAVLGFIGAPFTLASYLVEGCGTSDYREVKQMAFTHPDLLHGLLKRLTSNLANYASYQIRSGAQAIQIFDSWAGNLSPVDYDAFAGTYQRNLIAEVKRRHPGVPIILYINKASALLERMAASGADFVSVDWTIDLGEARSRLGDKVGVQGNLDPMVLLGPKEVISQRTRDILEKGVGARHIMNLGHGIDEHTSEENVRHFVDFVKNWKPSK